MNLAVIFILGNFLPLKALNYFRTARKKFYLPHASKSFSNKHCIQCKGSSNDFKSLSHKLFSFLVTYKNKMK